MHVLMTVNQKSNGVEIGWRTGEVFFFLVSFVFSFWEESGWIGF